MKNNKRSFTLFIESYIKIGGLYVIHYNTSGKGKSGKLNADQKRSALWSKCAAKFGKAAKCAAGAKSLRTTELDDHNWDKCHKIQAKLYCLSSIFLHAHSFSIHGNENQNMVRERCD